MEDTLSPPVFPKTRGDDEANNYSDRRAEQPAEYKSSGVSSAPRIRLNRNTPDDQIESGIGEGFVSFIKGGLKFIRAVFWEGEGEKGGAGSRNYEIAIEQWFAGQGDQNIDVAEMQRVARPLLQEIKIKTHRSSGLGLKLLVSADVDYVRASVFFKPLPAQTVRMDGCDSQNRRSQNTEANEIFSN